ncbi:OsmC family protein [Bradyrhizobium arachidis]|uniref:OsmC family protein n=1 Tax=Bradyrhizobium arachidis TaxID=858423 RepID=UPI0021622B64|nr:OsmC family protein [Bradyrhizobium arachidis]UVO35751.1 OsmC family protein [Bradyrhizobium arachidis]
MSRRFLLLDDRWPEGTALVCSSGIAFIVFVAAGLIIALSELNYSVRRSRRSVSEAMMALKPRNGFTRTQVVPTVDRAEMQSTFQSRALARSAGSISSSMRGQRSKNTARREALLEYALASLSASHEITYRLQADRLGIPLKGVAVRLTSSIDPSDIFRPRQDVGPQRPRIEAEVTLDSPASKIELSRLKETADRYCPALNIVRSYATVLVSVRTASLNAAAA